MQTRDVTFKSLMVGFIFLFGIVLIAVLGLIIGKNSALLSGFITYHIFVEDAEGLAENNFVSISGKKVGTVDKLKLTQKDGENGVDIAIKVDEKFAYLITNKAVASIKAIGILGDKYIDIYLSRDASDQLNANEYLEYKREPGIAELTSSATNIMQNLDGILSKINRGEGTVGQIVSSQELTFKLLSIVANTDRIVSDIAKGKGSFGKLLADESFAENLTEITSDFNNIIKEIKEGKGTAGKLLKDDKLYDDLASTTKQLKKILDEIEKGDGTVGQLIKNKELYQNIDRTIISLDSLIKDIKANPSKYINVKVF